MRLSAVGLLFLVCSGSAFAQADDFYQTLYARGMADYAVGNFGKAVDELRIASFGMLENPQQYELVQVYLAVLYDRLNRREESVKSVLQVDAVEKLRPTYASLAIPADIRATYDRISPALLHGEAASISDPGHGITREAPVIVRPVPVPPAAAATPSPVAQSDTALLERLVQQDPSSVPLRAALAEAKLNDGDRTAAQRFAGEVIAADPGNTSAHLVLARLAFASKQWREAIRHYDVVRSARKLEGRDNSSLFIALVNSEMYDRARDVLSELSPADSATPDVRDAAARLSAPRPSAPSQPPHAVAVQPASPPPAAATRAAAPSRTPPPAVQEPAREQARAAATPAAPQPKAQSTTPAPQTASPPAQQKPIVAQPGTANTTPPTVPSQQASPPQPKQNPQPPPAVPLTTTPVVAPPQTPPAPQQTSQSRKAESTTKAVTAPTPVQPQAPRTTGTIAAGEASLTPDEAQIAAAEKALAEGRFLQARNMFHRLASRPDHSRESWLRIGKGLVQVGSYAEASTAYDQAGRLKQGEEIHLFYKAVVLYELGDIRLAKQYLKLALPKIPMTREVAEFRSRIESAPLN